MSSNYVNIPGFGQGQALTPVADVFDLPTNFNNLGDTRLVLDTFLSYYWNGTSWMLIPSGSGSSGHLNQATDSVAIGDGTTLFTSTAGALNVNVVSTGAGGMSVSLYGEAASIAIGASQLILTYTVPVGLTLVLSNILYSGDSVGTFEVDFNSAPGAKGRLYFSQFNSSFNFSNKNGGYSLPAGTVVNVVATNASQQGVASFNATLQGIVG